MDGFEFIIFIVSGVCSLVSITIWYKRTKHTKHFEKDTLIEVTMSLLPVISLAIMLFTLLVLASFDVVNSFIYILFYILLGYAWIFLGMRFVFKYFDISWIDDVTQNRNKAALFAVAGAFLGISVIYAGANVGDSPG